MRAFITATVIFLLTIALVAMFLFMVMPASGVLTPYECIDGELWSNHEGYQINVNKVCKLND